MAAKDCGLVLRGIAESSRRIAESLRNHGINSRRITESSRGIAESSRNRGIAVIFEESAVPRGRRNQQAADLDPPSQREARPPPPNTHTHTHTHTSTRSSRAALRAASSRRGESLQRGACGGGRLAAAGESCRLALAEGDSHLRGGRVICHRRRRQDCGRLGADPRWQGAAPRKGWKRGGRCALPLPHRIGSGSICQ